MTFDIEKAIADAITLMKSAGGFYLRVREGLRPALWRSGGRRDVAPVNRDWLSQFLEDRSVENPYTVATAVLRLDFTDQFPPLRDDALELIKPPPRDDLLELIK
jgi:hypothetical protein